MTVSKRNGVLTWMQAVGCLLVIFGDSYPFVTEYPILSRTFSIFILSWPCQLAVEVLTERLLHLKYYVIMPCMFLTGVIVPCVVISLVDLLEKRRRHKPLTRLIGG